MLKAQPVPQKTRGNDHTQAPLGGGGGGGGPPGRNHISSPMPNKNN